LTVNPLNHPAILLLTPESGSTPSSTSSPSTQQHRRDHQRSTSRSQEIPVSLDRIEKRQRNNLAARKYRQKRIDRIEELEAALSSVTKERDELRIKAARSEAEIQLLKDMLHKTN
jgi:hypothetical protein